MRRAVSSTAAGGSGAHTCSRLEVHILEELNERRAAVDGSGDRPHIHRANTGAGFDLDFAETSPLLAPLSADDFECRNHADSAKITLTVPKSR